MLGSLNTQRRKCILRIEYKIVFIINFREITFGTYNASLVLRYSNSSNLSKKVKSSKGKCYKN